MNYIKRFGIKGFGYLAAHKLEGCTKPAPHTLKKLPHLPFSPEVSVLLKGAEPLEQTYENIELIKDASKAKGEYIAFIKEGDILNKNAIYLMMETLLRENADAVYCDEEGFYKPHWSPDTLMSCDYIGSFIIRRQLVEECKNPVDVLRGRYDIRVAHCDRPLIKSRRILHFYNEAIKDVKGKVSIIIPSKDNYEALRVCVESIRKKTKNRDFEIIVTDNGSSAETQKKYALLADKYIYEKCDFNFSHMCNIGAKAAEGRFLVFLNDDTEIIDGSWLDAMKYYAAKPHSGAVGVKLYYPCTKTIQHCGVINIQPGPAHALIGMEDKGLIYKGRNRGVWNYTAVTAACMMVEKSKFPCFDEDLKIAYNDVELCIRLLKSGYYNMVLNNVVLYHHESLTRGDDRLDREKLKRLALERKGLFEKHPDYCGRDDYYNVNLSPYRVDFSERNYTPYDRCRDYKEAEITPKGSFEYKIEYAVADSRIRISGYAYKKGFDRIYVLLRGGGRTYRFNTVREMRTDIEAMYGRCALLGGFSLMLEAADIPKGEYDVGIMLSDITGCVYNAVFTDKKVKC